MKIAIIDYGMGNLFSVQHACKFVGLQPFVTSDRKKILSADGAILPGVGAFGRAMNYLEQLGLIDTIQSFVRSGKPFMGICLGMQLLFSESEEFGVSKGLDIIPGNVLKFYGQDNQSNKIKIPQIGWNQIFKSKEGLPKSPLSGIKNGEFMYFVHSFYTVPLDSGCILTKTEYACIEYCSSILKENIFATQFHPEKSAKEGIKIYSNWSEMIRSQ